MAFYDDVVSADSPYVWLKLNETSGTTASDTQGRANFTRTGANGSVNQAALIKTGVAINISGTSTYYTATDVDVGTTWDDNNAVSLEFWFSVSSLSSAINLIRQGGDTTGYGIELNTNGSLHPWLSMASGAGNYFNSPTSSTGVVVTGTTYHCVLTWDGTNIKLYLNNTLVVNGSGAGTFAAHATNGVDFPGRFATGGGNRKYDEVAWYRSTLSAAQVEAHYNAGRGFWTESPPVTNVAVGGQAATVSTTAGVTINAPVSNVAVAGQSAVSHTDVNVVATLTNINVEGKTATVSASTPNATVNAPVTNIAVAGQAASVAAGGTVIVTATAAGVTLDAKDATTHTFSGAELLAATARTFETGLTLWNRNTTNTSAITRVSGISNSGTWSLKMTVAAANSEAAVYSDPITVDPDDTYTFEAWVMPMFTGDKSIHIDFYDATDVLLSSHTNSVDPLNVGNGSFYYLMWVDAQPDPTATYARLRIRGQNTAGNHVYVDDVSFRTSATAGSSIQPSNTNLLVGGLTASIILSTTQSPNAATITVDALDAEVATMPDAVNVTIGTDTTNIGVDAKTASVSLPNAYYTTVLADGPINWYRMNDTSGNPVDSISAKSLTKQAAGSITYSQSGIPTLVGTDNGLLLTGSGFDFNYTNMTNNSYEIWLKTSDTSFHIFGGVSGTAYSFVTVNSGVLGTTNQSTSFNSWGMNISNNQWHHLVLTEDKVGTVTTYKAYFDGSQIGAAGANIDGWNVNEFVLSNFTGYVDEFAVYNYALSAAQVADHYSKGAYAQADVEIDSITTANISVLGHANALTADIHADVANINISSEQPTIITPGQTSIGVPKTNVAVTGFAPTLTTSRSVTINAIPTSLAVRITDTHIRTMDDVFIFIPPDDSSLTARDASLLTSINLGAMLHNQEKFQAFKLGNTGNVPITLTVTVQSVNEDLDDLVLLSTDKGSYSGTIVIGTLQPNGISDPIWFRLDSGSVQPGHGSFLINVEQANA